MSIRLSGAQVTRIRESLDLHLKINWFEYRIHHWNIEELVEDILKEVLPCPINIQQTPNAPQSANVS